MPSVRIWRVAVFGRRFDYRLLANAPVPSPTQGLVERCRIGRPGIEGDVSDGPGPIEVYALHPWRI
jgi:hypothetical protein